MKTANYVYSDHKPKSLRGQVIREVFLPQWGKPPSKKGKQQSVRMYRGAHKVLHNSPRSKRYQSERQLPSWY